MRTLPRNQRGMTLLIGMIMLVIITMLVMSAIRTGLTNNRIVGNMQFRDEATYAAQAAIERTLGGTEFVSNPANVAANPISVDINGDGTSDYQVQMQPQPACVSYKVLKYGELTLPADLPCTEGVGASGSGSSTFIPGGFAAKNSLCANTHWKLTARATSNLQGSAVEVVQGTVVRVDTIFAEASCK